MKNQFLFLSLCAIVTTSLCAQQISTPIFVYKDGDASLQGYSGTDKELIVDGGINDNISWITFQTLGINFSKILSAKLVLRVNKLTKPGELQVRVLSDSIHSPENSLPYAKIPVSPNISARISLGSMQIENLIYVDLTTAVKSGTFKGVALTADDGLNVSFDSKEGHLAPILMITTSLTDLAAKWLSGSIDPISTIGKEGDFYLNQSNANVFSKISGKWVLSTNIKGPAGLKGDKGDKGDQGPRGEKGIQGLKGDKGDKGATGPMGDFPGGKSIGEIQYWNGTNWVAIPGADENRLLSIANSDSIPRWLKRPLGAVIDVEGNRYATIVLGEQEWTMENLRTKTFNDGTLIPTWIYGDTLKMGTTPAFAETFSGNTTINKIINPILYNYTAVQSGKLAPPGWKIPTNQDWDKLTNYLINNGFNYDKTTVGNKIAKSMADGVWFGNSQGSSQGTVAYMQDLNNSSGFTGFPTSKILNQGAWDPYIEAIWWSSTVNAGANGFARSLQSNEVDFKSITTPKYYGLAVRLVRDLN